MKETSFSRWAFDGDGFLSHVLSRIFYVCVCAAFMIPPLFRYLNGFEEGIASMACVSPVGME